MNKKKECKHDWKLSHTEWQFPMHCGRTTGAQEYAYFFCRKCLKVIKKKVINQ